MSEGLEQDIELSVNLIRAGRLDDALALLERCRAAQPDNPNIPRLIGEALVHAGRNLDACAPLVASLRLQPTPPGLRALLIAQFNLNDNQGIIDGCSHFRDMAWEDADIVGLWGFALNNTGRFAEAVDVLRRALELHPDAFKPRRNLSFSLAYLGRMEEAVEAFGGALPPWGGGGEETRPVEQLDAVAQGYDANSLHDSFSVRLLRLYMETFPGRRLKRVLELGTGTGLLASRLPASATRVDGVELSPAMLAQARARKVYDLLIEGAMPGILASVEGPYDTILSSCVLYHFADLRPFFAEAARLLEPGGAFAFSVDCMVDAHEIAVTNPGEYAHSRPYLRRLAVATGFREAAIEIDVHRGPPGFWCAFKKG
ncbi:methyltransferase [Paramagnetospirillum caucaseum]|uniref:Methyltransferase n=1 Tax=Paramagnetospirillum caucaseum TaxID=1244869 RepID=M2YD60_9PROT|nr:methyltransferase domain-containing protein [Paramagnetospirillum caucaseum]EME70931.1 methyltransferase [Paramagnetospirillum caucaseum]